MEVAGTAWHRFLELIEAVADGTITADDALERLQPVLEDGYCVYNLHAEFKAAFAYQPRRTAALPLIRSLARKIIGYPEDDTMLLFNEPEWAELVAMRGPVDGVELLHCDSCARTEAQFFVSGFLDIRPLTCTQCGDVLFQSTYADQPVPACGCGGRYSVGRASCARCGNALRRAGQVSGYQYFATHNFTRQDR